MATARHTRPPRLRLRTPEGTAKILGRHLAKHNLQVLLLAVGTLLGAVAAWFVLYLACSAVLVMAFSYKQVPQARVLRDFGIVYGVAAVCAVVYAWVDRSLTPDARPRDRKRPGEIFSEFVLVIPRMTLAVGTTLSAWLSLSRRDLQQAGALLHWMAEEKRIPMSSLRLVIPDPAAVERILFALQVTQIIDLQRAEHDLWLKFSSFCPPKLRPRSEDPAAVS